MGIIFAPILLILSSAIIPAIINTITVMKTEHKKKNVFVIITSSYMSGVAAAFISPFLFYAKGKVYIFSLLAEIWIIGGGALIFVAFFFWLIAKKNKNGKATMVLAGLCYAAASLPYLWFTFAKYLIKLFDINAHY